MQLYKNMGGNSGVQAFAIGRDYIDVKFDGARLYRYSYASAGKGKVEEMKRLALQGWGVNSYINRYARQDYER